MVPEGWRNKAIGELISFSGGSQPPRNTFVFEPRDGYIRLIQIRDYKTDKYATYIPKELAKKFCNKDDVMIGRYGPPVFQILRGIEGAYNVALIKASPKKGILRDYMYYFLAQETLQKYIERFSQRGAGQTGIEMDQLNEYPLPLPSEYEQKRIVKLLSTWDSAIEKQAALIRAKEQRKRALMQQLLTGKTRFKEFEGQVWTEKPLSLVLQKIVGGGTPSRDNPDYWTDEGIPWITVKDLKGHIVDDAQEHVTKLGLDESASNLIPSDTVIVATRMAVGKAVRCTKPAAINQDLKALIPKQIVTTSYLHYALMANEAKLEALGTGSTVKGIRLSDLQKLVIGVPSASEQQKIASVLSTADREIHTLQTQLDAYKQQKRGLMQQLLTGKTRVKLDEVLA